MSTKQKKIIAMAGGGTGGHVMPIRSLLETLFKTPEDASQVDKVYRFGSSHSLEQEAAISLSKAGDSKPTLHFQPILSWKFRRERSFSAFLKNAKDLFLFSLWFFQSLRYLKKFHVSTVFCKGGYVALPVVFATHFLRIKLVVHESDVHPGLVNRIASRYASAIFTGFDKVLPKAVTVGQILSDEIVPVVATPAPSSSLPTVFVMWGSQGSRVLYETFAKLLNANPLIASSFFFYISLGKLNDNLKPLFSHKNVQTFDFLTQKEMGEIYEKSDLCLARGGTTSLAEQKLFNIKSIIVPIPRTHDQLDNGKWFVRHYQDILLDQNSPTFLSDMEQVFLSLVHYHKLSPERDIFTEIQQAKKLIWEEILR